MEIGENQSCQHLLLDSGQTRRRNRFGVIIPLSISKSTDYLKQAATSSELAVLSVLFNDMLHHNRRTVIGRYFGGRHHVTGAGLVRSSMIPMVRWRALQLRPTDDEPVFTSD